MSELLHLLTNPAHWAFEVISDAAVGLIAAPLIRHLVRLHDRRKH